SSFSMGLRRGERPGAAVAGHRKGLGARRGRLPDLVATGSVGVHESWPGFCVDSWQRPLPSGLVGTRSADGVGRVRPSRHSAMVTHDQALEPGPGNSRKGPPAASAQRATTLLAASARQRVLSFLGRVGELAELTSRAFAALFSRPLETELWARQLES